MTTGMLWYDSDPQHPIEQIVRDAARRYAEKFGSPPDHACVNPADQAGVATVDGITLEPSPNILRHHVWIGCESS